MVKETIICIKEQLSTVTNIDDPRFAVWKEDERKGVQTAVISCIRRLEKEKKEKERLYQMMEYERNVQASGARFIAGIDEAGRGPLAGPVVAAACILPEGFLPSGLNDSKKMSESARDHLYELIMNHCQTGVGIISAEEIDEINIYEAAKKAMVEAVKALPEPPDHLLVDAMVIPGEVDQTSIIKGDAKSASIAAASIVAKVTRDRLMKEYALKYPGYGFNKNMGYGTSEHLHGLKKYGITPQHRKTFAPVKEMLNT
ncbi:ribonuclease HII [Domibacillus epiphyticus]|uniref:Ribonuclease HII n=1 Tax=Domibacillus epiphyticus TaxID=1714355 RepID=A0A1V2AC58_9BACI|nr:ribonuclease HII [Domibacillus epiphyticus]OMP68583.1 ribonuclease HII [Domibacillus epiphyticus]